ncbi:MAG TPA: ROK family protein [Planctomicrobium sp.]|nr:ROK family protein [Planctomicrobium sp.]
MRLLVTGFPPFPGRPANPSAQLIQALVETPLLSPQVEIIAELLPVEYAGVEQAFDELLERVNPDIWIAFGVGRQACPLRIEQRGLNRDHASIPDNAGETRTDHIIEPDGPPVRWLTADLLQLSQVLASAEFDVELSDDAGAYVCNHLIYHAAKSLNECSHRCEFVFIHLAPPESGLPTEKLLVALQNMAGWFQNQLVASVRNPELRGTEKKGRRMASDETTQYWMGFDLGGTKMLAQVYDANWNVIAKERKRIRPGTPVKGGLDRIIETVNEALAKANLTPANLKGIGIGCPGPIDMENGVLLDLPNLGWQAVPLRERLSSALNCPVAVLNDVDAGTFAEYKVGAGQGARTMISVFAGTGIGGGCVYHGEILRGATVSCFEIGHMQVMSNGPRCGCGQRGCLESVSSRLAIAAQCVRTAYRGDAPHLLAETGTDLANVRSGALKASIAAGDKAVEDIIKEAARYIGIAVGSVVNLLSPDVVVLGGGLVEAMPDLFIPTVSKAAAKRVMPAYRDTFKVVPAALKDDAGVLGAALWAEYKLSPTVKE